MKNLKGKTALITGGTSKLGREIAIALAKEGVNIIIHYNKAEKVAKNLCNYINALGVKGYELKADFEKENERKKLIEKALKIDRELSILINNASIYQSPERGTFDEFMRNLEVNTWTPYFLSVKFAEEIKTGEIINILDARIKRINLSSPDLFYILSKHLLALLTQKLANQFSPKIRVNGIAPGRIIPSPKGEKVKKFTSKIISILKDESMNGKIITVE